MQLNQTCGMWDTSFEKLERNWKFFIENKRNGKCDLGFNYSFEFNNMGVRT